MPISESKNQVTVVKMTALAIVLAFTIGAFGPITSAVPNPGPAPEANNSPLISPQNSEIIKPSTQATVPNPVKPNTIVIQQNETQVKDATIESLPVNLYENYGDDDRLFAGNQTGDTQYRGLLQIDLPPVTAKLLSATLSLNGYGFSAPGINVTVRALATTWNEKQVNWINRSNGVAWTTPGGDFSASYISYSAVTVEDVWTNWNVTSLVNAWLSGTIVNNGFLISGIPYLGPMTNSVRFYSSNESVASLRPKLTLTYAAEITNLVPAQSLQEDGPATTISLSGRSNGTVEHLSGIGTTNNAFPFFGASYSQTRVQYLYNRSQIGAEGVIRGISLQRIALTGIGNFSNFQIRMAHTDLTALTTTYDNNYNGSLIEVFPLQAIFVNSSNKDIWIHFNLNGNFTYDSHHNLLIDFSWNGDGGTDVRTWIEIAADRRLYGIGAAATGIGVDDQLTIMRFSVDAVDNAVFDDGTISNWLLFNSGATYAKIQMLYNASDLGRQAGIINKIGFYKDSSMNSVFPNLNISIAYTNNNTNTTSSSLNANFTHNYVGSLTNVFYKASHRFRNESGWYDFDIADFAYDGHRNLLIQIDWSGTVSGTDVMLYRGGFFGGSVNNWTWTNTAGAFTGTIDSRFYNMRLTFAESANLSWSASSSNPAMFTAGVTGRTLTITPLANQFGTGTVTLQLTNSNGLFVTQNIPVTINAVNDAPLLAALANLPCVEDVPTPLNISSKITDIDDVIGNIKVTTTSLYDTIVGTLITFTYPEGVSGETITVTITDSGGLTATQQLVTHVTMVNDPPQFTGFVSNITCDATVLNTISFTPTDEETQPGQLKISSASPYANVSGHSVRLLYPKGIGTDQVTVVLSDNITYGRQNNVSYLLNVTIIDHPDVTAHTPTGIGVAVTTTVVATFDMAMNRTKAQNAFSLALGTVAVTGNFTWNSNSTVMTFTPAEHLTNGLYVVRIAASAENTAGIRMLNAYSWNFTAALGTFDGDSDGMADQWEMDNGLDPNVNDAQGDADGDGMPNIYEFENDLDPQLNDAQGDADGDGMPNIYEYENDLDPQSNDANLDSDDDGATNIEEYEAGTDPNDPESKPSEFTWIIWVIILVAIIAVVAIVLLLMTRKPKSVQLQQAYEQGQEDAQLDMEEGAEGGSAQPEEWSEPPQEGLPPEQGGQPPQPGSQ